MLKELHPTKFKPQLGDLVHRIGDLWSVEWVVGGYEFVRGVEYIQVYVPGKPNIKGSVRRSQLDQIWREFPSAPDLHVG